MCYTNNYPWAHPNCSHSATLLSVHPGGEALIVSCPTADTTLVSGVCGVCTTKCYIETVRIVQWPNDPKREWNGETTETARRSEKVAHSSKFVPRQWPQVCAQAAPARSWPGSGRRFVPRQYQQVRVQAAAESSCPDSSSKFQSRQRAGSKDCTLWRELNM
jgi:hypothetical protein